MFIVQAMPSVGLHINRFFHKGGVAHMKRVAWMVAMVLGLISGVRVVRAEAPPFADNLGAQWFQQPGAVNPQSPDLQFVGHHCGNGGGGGNYGGYGGGYSGYGYSGYSGGNVRYINPSAYQTYYMGTPSSYIYSSGYLGQNPGFSNFNSYYYNSYRPPVYPQQRYYYNYGGYGGGGGGHGHCR